MKISPLAIYVTVAGQAVSFAGLFFFYRTVMHNDAREVPAWFCLALLIIGQLPIAYIYRDKLSTLVKIAAPFIPRVNIGSKREGGEGA